MAIPEKYADLLETTALADVATIGPTGIIRLEGRLKEIINVGGDKVSPFEVEEALLAHPAVIECAAFGTPSPLLGEEVNAVVTLCSDVDERQLRAFARERLAKFKTPTTIHIVDQIPKGPTGKVQRTRLGAQLRR